MLSRYTILQTSNVINASLQSYWGETVSLPCIPTPPPPDLHPPPPPPHTHKKTKLKMGHNFAKILQMITNNELDLYLTMIYPSAKFH